MATKKKRQKKPRAPKGKLWGPCTRCQHTWYPYKKAGRDPNEPPLYCPSCHSAYWNRDPVNRQRTPREARPPSQARQQAAEVHSSSSTASSRAVAMLPPPIPVRSAPWD